MLRTPRLPLLAALALFACGGSNTSNRQPATPALARGADASTASDGAGTGTADRGSDVVPAEAKIAEPPPVDLADWAAAAATIGVKPSPPACAAFAKRRAATAATCVDRDAALARLDAAMRETDVAKRDAALEVAESCNAFPPGWVRALRADLAPPACADALVDPLLRAGGGGATGHVLHALAGLSIAGRLARTVGAAPRMALPYEKKRLAAYFQGPFRRWIVDQARVIDELGRFGAKLSFYGRGVAAVEAGLADMRFVGRARELPIPAEWAKDDELRNAYYGALDQALDPRKDRGRDAALVGLQDFASVGSVHDARIDRARRLLTELYAGRRIDALDALILPPLPALAPATADERLAATLPTFFAGEVIDPATALRPPVLRALLARGTPARVRAALVASNAPNSTGLADDERLLMARAFIDRGRTYWIAADFARARSAAANVSGDDAKLLATIALPLRTGPRDAVEMMHAATPAALHLGPVAALDALAQSNGPHAARATFDAAAILGVAPPDGAGPPFFRDLARRYHDAAEHLEGAEKTEAEARAKAAEATAEAAR